MRIIYNSLLALTLTGTLLLESCKTVAPILTLPTAPGTTSNAESLTRETNEPSQEFYPKVSPDGKYLLYFAAETEKVEVQSNPNNGYLAKLFEQSTAPSKVKSSGTIVKKEIGSQIRSPLVQDAKDAIWLPDGSGVIFSYRKPAQPVIVKTNSNGVGLNYISQGAMGSNDSEPNVTKDGSKVIFNTLVGSSKMICSMSINGGSFTVLTEGEHVSVNPVNSDQIIYNLTVNGRTQIFTTNLKTGQKSQITSGEFDCRDGAFSFDGNWIAYSSNQESPNSGKYHIYMMKVDGTDVRQLTQGSTNEGDPCWSPDNWVFFYSNAASNYNIWKVKPRF
jgi:TolB protein